MTCCVNSWVFVFLLVIISLFVWFPVSNTDLLHWCAVALTVTHSSSLTNRITAKRKKSPRQLSPICSPESSEQPNEATSGPSRVLGNIHLSCFVLTKCCAKWWMDDWDGSCWWAEEVEIEKQRVRGWMLRSFWGMARKCGRMALWALGAVLLSGYIYMETGLYDTGFTLLINRYLYFHSVVEETFRSLPIHQCQILNYKSCITYPTQVKVHKYCQLHSVKVLIHYEC